MNGHGGSDARRTASWREDLDQRDDADVSGGERLSLVAAIGTITAVFFWNVFSNKLVPFLYTFTLLTWGAFTLILVLNRRKMK